MSQVTDGPAQTTAIGESLKGDLDPDTFDDNIGGLCYAMLLARRQWYARDLADLEHRLLSNENRGDLYHADSDEQEEVCA